MSAELETGRCCVCQVDPISPIDANCWGCGGSGRMLVIAGGIPASTRKPADTNPMTRFRDGKRTRSAAIKAQCAHCMGCTYDAIEPGFRSMIRDCTSKGCPLYSFRPYQRNDTDEDETE